MEWENQRGDECCFTFPKKEVIRLRKVSTDAKALADRSADKSALAGGENYDWEETWTGDYVFENEWQDFRTKKKRELVLQPPPVEVGKGKRKIAVKVVDIFGNDTMKIIEINV